MCDEQHHCKCFHAGAEDLVERFMVWATGAHGDACRCSDCDMALMMMANGMGRLAQVIRNVLREPKARPPSGHFDAGGSLDF